MSIARFTPLVAAVGGFIITLLLVGWRDGFWDREQRQPPRSVAVASPAKPRPVLGPHLAKTSGPQLQPTAPVVPSSAAAIQGAANQGGTAALPGDDADAQEQRAQSEGRRRSADSARTH